MIGQGSFGAVFLGLNQYHGELLAVKEFRIQGSSETIVEQVRGLQREISILQQIRHPNIVRYRGTEREGNVLRVFLEYVAGGSLSSIIKQFGPLHEDIIRQFCTRSCT